MRYLKFVGNADAAAAMFTILEHAAKKGLLIVRNSDLTENHSWKELSAAEKLVYVIGRKAPNSTTGKSPGESMKTFYFRIRKNSDGVWQCFYEGRALEPYQIYKIKGKPERIKDLAVEHISNLDYLVEVRGKQSIVEDLGVLI